MGSNVVPRTPLTRQMSIYSLTLEEFQSAIHEPGKTLGSMNMEELLKSIWTAEEGQAMAAAMAGDTNLHPLSGTPLARQPSLQRQGSLALPPTLGSKTVDEVWRDIHQRSAAEQTPVDKKHQHGERQVTMGEMTLEDFLSKAGVMRDEAEAGPSGVGNGNNGIATFVAGPCNQMNGIQSLAPLNPAHQVEWRSYQHNTSSTGLLQHQLIQHHQTIPLLTDPLNAPYDGTRTVQGLSLLPASLTPDASMRAKKRPMDFVDDKLKEQRQKRMIKNRESAARSRARKQAYTVDLEAELNELKEENMRLKQQQEEADANRRKQLIEALIPVTEWFHGGMRAVGLTRTTSL